MRALIVQRIRQEQWPPAEAAAAAGVSVRTTYKWLRRHRLGGRPALEDRLLSAASPAAAHVARRPSRAIVAARHERRTAWAIATRLQVPRSTVAAVLVRVGLNRLARLDPPPPVQRYERTRPGELVHLDIKPLGRILRVGHRIHPHRRSSVGAGWEYVHVAVDDYSRAAYVEVLPDQTGATTAGFLTTHRRLVCSARHRGRARPHRQRQRLHQPAISRTARTAPRPTHADPPVPAPDQRQSRTLHSDAHSRLGLRRVVSQLVASHARAPSLAPALQRRAAARRTRLSTTVRPLSEGRAVINLVRSHSSPVTSHQPLFHVLSQ